MDNAFFWCGCQQAFEGVSPEKCLLHGDTVSRIVDHYDVEPPPEKPEKPEKPKTKASKR